MGRAVILSRKEVTERLARTAQYMAGAAVVTVSMTWADETDTQIAAQTHTATAYGETSSGKPLGSLPGEVPAHIAVGHLNETSQHSADQAKSIADAVDAALAAKEGPPPEGAGTELEGSEVEESALAHEEANADSHE